MIGKTLGKYKILEELGSGSMATVYKAVHISLGREVAIKVLPHSFSADAELVERFRREARAAARLNHPNIVQIYDICEDEGIYYLVSEYCGGETLDKVISRGKLPVSKVVPILIQVGGALNYAHRKQIIHRDVKPGNIMTLGNNESKLMDLGVALSLDSSRITATGTTIGTPEYMSPEQAGGKAIDKRSDIYSLAVVAYEALTGRLPFASDNPVELVKMHTDQRPPSINELNPDVPARLARIISRAMEAKTEDRYQSMEDFVQDIENFASPAKTARATSIDGSASPGTLIQEQPAGAQAKKHAIKILKLLAPLIILLMLIFLALPVLRINSVPEGAAVYIDGTVRGVTPLTIRRIMRGQHQLALRKRGYREQRTPINVTLGRCPFSFNLEKEFGLLRVLSVPAGAEVYIDGALAGKTPLLLKDIKFGEHKLRLTLKNFEEKEETLKIDSDRLKTAELSLESILAGLLVESTPAANLYIDGKLIGVTPQKAGGLSAGRHVVLLTKNGYLNFRKIIFLEEKESQILKAELKEKLTSLQVYSTPAGASVFLNGEEKGETPLYIRGLRWRKYKLRIAKKGYKEVIRELMAGDDERIIRVRLVGITGSALIITDPPNAQVYIDGKEAGATKRPLTVDEIPKGAHQLQIVKHGYKTQEQTFLVEVGKTTVIEIKLARERKVWKPTVIIRLKNGSELKGEIVRKTERELTIKLSPTMTTTISTSRIELIEKIK